MAILLISSHVVAQEAPQVDSIAGAEQELPVAVPDLADIIPLATELGGRLATLERQIMDGLDVFPVQKQYAELEAHLKDPAGQLQQLKESRHYKYNKLVELREAIKQDHALFEKISEPLNQDIRQLGTWREEWLAEKKRWNEWQSSLLKEEGGDQLEPTFQKANETIHTALNLVLPHLEAVLTVQEKAGHIQAKIDALAVEVDGLMVEERRVSLLNAHPPMFSPQYFSQFSGDLWYAVHKGLDQTSWPDSQFFAQKGWIILVQSLLSLFLIIAVYRNRGVLKESERWRFLAARPISAGLFLGYMGTVLIYEYEGMPQLWELAGTMLGGISFARLAGSLIEASWKRQFVKGLIIALIVTRLLDVFSFPLPLFRLSIVVAAVAGLLLCLRWAGECRRRSDPDIYTWSLRLGALVFAVIIIGELWGKEALAFYLFFSLIGSIATAFVFILFGYMIHGGLEWLFRTASVRRAIVLQEDEIDAVIRRVARVIDVAIGVFLLSGILMIWRVYGNFQEAMKGLLAFGFTLGSQRISVGLVLGAAGIIYGAFFISWILQRLLMHDVLVRRRVEKGVRLSIGRLIHYVLVFVALSFALLVVGFELTQLTILLSAIGVGIGFGLQGVVNNFVSGLILLFERPIRVGDYIEIEGKWAEINRIGLRATNVQTFDHADLIIPNADLVSRQVTNWTLSNRRVRVYVPVGVAYGSDVPLVMETLWACAKANAKVSTWPRPQVLFLGFGESSLEFELRVWALEAGEILNLKSELHQEVDRRFREAKIEIAFPQRDLHVRSVDDSVVFRSPQIAREAPAGADSP